MLAGPSQNILNPCRIASSIATDPDFMPRLVRIASARTLVGMQQGRKFEHGCLLLAKGGT